MPSPGPDPIGDQLRRNEPLPTSYTDEGGGGPMPALKREAMRWILALDSNQPDGVISTPLTLTQINLVNGLTNSILLGTTQQVCYGSTGSGSCPTYFVFGGGSTITASSGFAVTGNLNVISPSSLNANSFQTYSGGAQAMLIATTGTGNVTLGNATSGSLSLSSTATLSTILQVNGSLTAGASQSDTVSLAGAAAGSPATITASGTNAGIQFKVTGTGVVSAVAPLVSFVPKRMSQEYHVNLVTDTAFTAVGLPAPTLLAGTPTADTTDAAYQMIKFTTGATSGNASGFSGPFTVTAGSYLPVFASVVRTDPAAVTTTRDYVGFGASSLDQVATLAGANTIRGCWFRYDTGLSDANWFAESSDGTTASATDTTVTVAAATTYTLAIDATTAGACDFYVNGVLKTHKISNVPTASNTALGLEASVTTLAASARALSVSKAILQQN